MIGRWLRKGSRDVPFGGNRDVMTFSRRVSLSGRSRGQPSGKRGSSCSCLAGLGSRPPGDRVGDATSRFHTAQRPRGVVRPFLPSPVSDTGAAAVANGPEPFASATLTMVRSRMDRPFTHRTNGASQRRPERLGAGEPPRTVLALGPGANRLGNLLAPGLGRRLVHGRQDVAFPCVLHSLSMALSPAAVRLWCRPRVRARPTCCSPSRR